MHHGGAVMQRCALSLRGVVWYSNNGVVIVFAMMMGVKSLLTLCR